MDSKLLIYVTHNQKANIYLKIYNFYILWRLTINRSPLDNSISLENNNKISRAKNLERPKICSVCRNHNSQTTKDWATETPLLTGNELMWSERVCSSWSTSGTSRVTLDAKTVIGHEWGKDRIVITTNGTYFWSLQVLRTWYFVVIF
jgi:hypothetical protein